MSVQSARFYDDFAEWWPLFSPPAHYVEEAADLLPRIHRLAPQAHTLLELGSGGGSLAFHLKPHFELTLTDRSPGMLGVSRRANPECEHLLGDMRDLRLGRAFDLVLIHDAIVYATTPADVRAALRTAALHCRAGGLVVVIPDHVRETFAPETAHGGEDGSDERALRYLEWSWDPDPADDIYLVDYAFLLRETDGTVTAVHDRHVEGLFARAAWIRWFAESGLAARAEADAWGRDVFLAVPSHV